MQYDAMPPPAAGRSSDIVVLLADEGLSLLFRDYLRSIHGSENLSFWVEVELFRALDGKPEMEIEYDDESHSLWASFVIHECRDRALDIFAKYLRLGCEHEINVDQQTRTQLMIEMASVKPTLFDEAQREIRALLETDSIPKFRKDPSYVQYLDAKTKHQNDKAKNDKKGKKDTYSPSLVSKLLNRKEGDDKGHQQQQRGRSETLDALAAWREHRQGKSPSSSSSGSTLTLAPSNPGGVLPRRAVSNSPATVPEGDSPLSLSAPNPTGPPRGYSLGAPRGFSSNSYDKKLQAAVAKSSPPSRSGSVETTPMHP